MPELPARPAAPDAPEPPPSEPAVPPNPPVAEPPTETGPLPAPALSVVASPPPPRASSVGCPAAPPLATPAAPAAPPEPAQPASNSKTSANHRGIAVSGGSRRFVQEKMTPLEPSCDCPSCPARYAHIWVVIGHAVARVANGRRGRACREGLSPTSSALVREVPTESSPRELVAWYTHRRHARYLGASHRALLRAFTRPSSAGSPCRGGEFGRSRARRVVYSRCRTECLSRRRARATRAAPLRARRRRTTVSGRRARRRLKSARTTVGGLSQPASMELEDRYSATEGQRRSVLAITRGDLIEQRQRFEFDCAPLITQAEFATDLPTRSPASGGERGSSSNSRTEEHTPRPAAACAAKSEVHRE